MTKVWIITMPQGYSDPIPEGSVFTTEAAAQEYVLENFADHIKYIQKCLDADPNYGGGWFDEVITEGELK